MKNIKHANIALILVDIQKDFCQDGALAIPGAEEIIKPTNQLLKQFQQTKNGANIFVTRDWHPKGHISFASSHNLPPLSKVGSNTVWPDHCVQGTKGADLHDRLNITNDIATIYKGVDKDVDSYSAFYDNNQENTTELNTLLQDKYIDTLIVVGLATDYCVKATVLDAIALGYEVIVVPECCRGIQPPQHTWNQLETRGNRKGAQIIPLATLLNQLQTPSLHTTTTASIATPEF